MEGWVFGEVFAGGHVYFYTINTEAEVLRYYVHALDASTGTSEWKFLVEGEVRFPGVVYDGSVYLTAIVPFSDGHRGYAYLMSLDASTGSMNRQYRVDNWINTPAVEFGGYIYFGTYSGGDDYLYSIDPGSGELNRRYPTEGGSYIKPLFADGKVYVIVGMPSTQRTYRQDGRTGNIDREAYLLGSQCCLMGSSTSTYMMKGRRIMFLAAPLMPQQGVSSGS